VHLFLVLVLFGLGWTVAATAVEDGDVEVALNTIQCGPNYKLKPTALGLDMLNQQGAAASRRLQYHLQQAADVGLTKDRSNAGELWALLIYMQNGYCKATKSLSCPSI
jgi:hypothetical protein